MTTSRKVAGPFTNPPPDLTLQAEPVVVLPSDSGPGKLVLDAESDFKTIRSVRLLNRGTPNEVSPPPTAARNGRKQITLSFKPETPPGDYDLEVAVEYAFSAAEDETWQGKFPISVRKQPPK